jgi:WD40 repeat protein
VEYPEREIETAIQGANWFCRVGRLLPDGETIAAGTGYPGNMLLWNAHQGTLRQTIKVSEGFVATITFSPDYGSSSHANSVSDVRLSSSSHDYSPDVHLADVLKKVSSMWSAGYQPLSQLRTKSDQIAELAWREGKLYSALHNADGAMPMALLTGSSAARSALWKWRPWGMRRQ